MTLNSLIADMSSEDACFSTLLCPSASSFSSLLGYSIIFGLFHGSLSTVVYMLVLTSVHEGQRALALGFWLFCMSIMIACGPPLASR